MLNTISKKSVGHARTTADKIYGSKKSVRHARTTADKIYGGGGLAGAWVGGGGDEEQSHCSVSSLRTLSFTL